MLLSFPVPVVSLLGESRSFCSRFLKSNFGLTPFSFDTFGPEKEPTRRKSTFTVSGLRFQEILSNFRTGLNFLRLRTVSVDSTSREILEPPRPRLRERLTRAHIADIRPLPSMMDPGIPSASGLCNLLQSAASDSHIAALIATHSRCKLLLISRLTVGQFGSLTVFWPSKPDFSARQFETQFRLRQLRFGHHFRN